MASKTGRMVAGTDGTDFSHRETVASHYHISVVNKGRLRKGIFAHLLLGLWMLIKLIPDILDQTDIFILEIEELEIPQPKKWEYIWLLGTVSCFVGLTAIRRNRAILLQVYFVLVNLLSTIPVLYAFMLHSSEFVQFCTATDRKSVLLWQGYPLAALWYAFLVIATQVHLLTLFSAWKLIALWKTRGTKKQN